MNGLTQDVYITATGAFLPGEPVPNDEMEDYLGKIGGVASTAKKHVLKQNGIQQRHYAIDRSGNRLHANHEMAALAVSQAVERSPLLQEEVEYLAASTTLNDVFLPGFSSLVQDKAGLGECEVASFSGVCASGMAALKACFAIVKSGEHANAAACGSEFASQHLRAERYEELESWNARKEFPLDADFLRWMLSDGAGAFLLQNQPQPEGLSLRIDWMDHRSHGNFMDVCMFAGGQKDGDGRLERFYSDYRSLGEAVQQGLFILRQDLNLLEKIVPLGVKHYMDLLNTGKLDPDFDWSVCHYSSHLFRSQIQQALEHANLAIPEEKWFTNLYTKGNTGSASLYIMLDELYHSGKLKAGDKILCHVPESGRFITCFMHLTVVGGREANNPAEIKQDVFSNLKAPLNPLSSAEPRTTKDKMMQQLLSVWFEFEKDLLKVPLLKKLALGKFGMEDYRRLLLNLRQQVMEGSRWISRAASNISVENFEIRSKYIKHSVDEHRDFKMLEKNYESVGGKKADILSYPKNIGSEAFSSYMFHQADQKDPLNLIGSVFIIEGLGRNLARRWGEAIRKQLDLKEEQVSFLLYHGSNDETHLKELDEVIEMLTLDEPLADAIVKAAKTTARLYRLQLEEIGNT